ncbi:zinc finger, CCHC-type containing protein [Tanacetum coccineum]
MITQGLILTRRQNLLVRNVAKLVTLKGITKVLMLATKPMVQAQRDDDVTWWVDSGATVHVCKDRCWFKTYESLNDGSILHIGNESTAMVHEHGCVDLRPGHVHFKRMQDMSKDGLIPAFDMDTEKCNTCMPTKITKKPFQNVKRETKVLELIHSDLCDLHATLSLGNKKYFVTFIDDASRFCYIYLLHTKNEALDKFKVFKTEVELQQGSLIKRFRTDRGVPNKRNKAVVGLPDPKLKTLGERCIECIFVGYWSLKTEEVVHQPEPELRKSKRDKTPKDFGPEFQLYLIEETSDEVSDQHSYCFNVEDDPKKFDEAMKSQDVAFWKEEINDEMDSIMGNNTWVLADLPPGIDYFDTYALVARISAIRLLIAMTSIHNLIIHQMDVKTTFLNGELDEEVYMNQPQGFIMPGNENKVCKLIKSLYGLKQVDLTKEFLSLRFSMKDMGEADVIMVDKLSRYTSNPGTQHWQTIQRISNAEDNSSTSGWVFLLGGGAISWVSKKQTCITGSTIESEFVALAAAGKEAEWLRNLILEIPLWSKPITPISIRYDSVATLAKAYSQMYNGKSRHLGVRHSMIRELIMNGVISIESTMFSMKVHYNGVFRKYRGRIYDEGKETIVEFINIDEVAVEDMDTLMDQLERWGEIALSTERTLLEMASKNLMQMSTDIVKLDCFDGGSFKRWQKKMHFLLAALNVAYVLTNPYPEESENETLAESRECLKFGNDDFICCGHILNVMSDPLFNVYQNYPTARELWKALEERYLTKDATNLGKHLLIEEQYCLENKANDDTSKVHLVEEKRESSKLKTMEYGLEYNGDPSILEGYTNASRITNQEDYASTTRWIFTLGGGAVSWVSKKHICLTDSTMAAEFVALALCCKEA